MGLYGENHNKAKLTQEDVAFIKANYGWRAEPGSGKISGADLAKRFGTTAGAILQVVRGLAWNGKPTARRTIEPRYHRPLKSDCEARKNRI